MRPKIELTFDLHKQCFPVGMLRADGQIRDLSRNRTRQGRVEPQLVFSSVLNISEEILKKCSALVVDISQIISPDGRREALGRPKKSVRLVSKLKKKLAEVA